MQMDPKSVPLRFECNGANLYGILTVPQAESKRAVVIVVGGPQYRVGSHRQFVLLARFLASNGVPTLRFDHRGFGDADGETTFQELEPDIRAAIDNMVSCCTEVEDIVIWGLCDAASAAMMYAPTDPRVKGLVLLNPWVRDDASLARAQFRQAITNDLTNSEKWKRLVSGRISLSKAVLSLGGLFYKVLRGRVSKAASGNRDSSKTEIDSYQDRMLSGLGQFQGQVLLVLSGQDITAREFDDLADSDSRWGKCLERRNTVIMRLEESTHTFSRREWRDQVAQWTLEWLRRW